MKLEWFQKINFAAVFPIRATISHFNEVSFLVMSNGFELLASNLKTHTMWHKHVKDFLMIFLKCVYIYIFFMKNLLSTYNLCNKVDLSDWPRNHNTVKIEEKNKNRTHFSSSHDLLEISLLLKRICLRLSSSAGSVYLLLLHLSQTETLINIPVRFFCFFLQSYTNTPVSRIALETESFFFLQM